MDPAPTLSCDCGKPWDMCAPGTAPDAKTYPSDKIVDLFSWTTPEPMRVWCLACWIKQGARQHA